MTNRKTKKRKLSHVITAWLLATVILACSLSVLISSLVISSRSEALAGTIVRLNVEDLITDIEEKMEYNTSGILRTVLENFLYYLSDSSVDFSSADTNALDEISRDLQEQAQSDSYEYNVVNKDGIIIVSSILENLGFDIKSGEQTSEFKVLLDGTAEEYNQGLMSSSIDGGLMRYSGKVLPDESGFVLVGMAGDNYMEWLLAQLENDATNRRIGRDGYFLICSEDQTVINSLHGEHNGEDLSDSGLIPGPGDDDAFKTVVYGTPSYVVTVQNGSYYVIGIYPEEEIMGYANGILLMTILLEILVFGLLFLLLSILLKKKVVHNIVRVNDSLHQITAGNLEEKVDVRETVEFDILSDDINKTVDRLKGYITEAEERIDRDLAVAKAIQTSILPTHFPAFPDKKEFELYAGMKAAKEVGGDFYDFFMIDETTLGFLIADVSGKSIPGAMFMMRAKTVIKEMALQGLPPGEVMTAANRKLCEGNDAGMFVTVWMGFLDIGTGIVHAVNAGHNPPLLIRDGRAEYLKLKPSMIMGTFDIARYQEHTFTLEPGDILYLYTDGVTEAENTDAAYYGEEKLQKLLSFGNKTSDPSEENCIAEAVCRMVEKDLSMYTKGAEQSDDITMLCIRFNISSKNFSTI